MNDKVYELPQSTNKRVITFNNGLKNVKNTLETIDNHVKRGFEAAESSRLLMGWSQTIPHINDDILIALKSLRARSRELYQNNSIVQNYFQLLDTNIVGSEGFKLKTKTKNKAGVLNTKNNDVVDAAFSKWCNKKYADIAGKNTFKNILSLVVAAVARDGEALVVKHRFKPSKANPFGFSLQVLNVDLIDVHYNVAEKDGVSIIMGVEVNSFGKVLAYYFNSTENRQNTSRSASNRKRIPAEDVYHIFNQEYPEQLRGIPWLHSVMKTIYQLASYEDYTLVAARVGASKMGFFTTSEDSTGGAERLATGKNDQDEFIYEAEPGMFEVLPPGYKFESFTPEFPAQIYDLYVKSLKRSIANGLRVCYNTLYGDLENVNYSSIRQALIAERDMYKSLHSWIKTTFINEVFEDWIKESFLNGALVDITGYQVPLIEIDNFVNNYEFQGRTWGWVDPKADIEAAKSAKDIGVYSPSLIADMMGVDIFQQIQETALVIAEAKKYGVYIENLHDPLAALQAQQAQAQNQVANENQSKSLENIDRKSQERTVDLVNRINDIKNSVEISKLNQKSSDINVNPQVNVEAPIVNVSLASKKVVKTVPVRDERGLIISIDSVIEDIEEEIQEEVSNVEETIQEEKALDIQENIVISDNIEETKSLDVIVQDELVEEIALETGIEELEKTVEEVANDS